MTSTMIRIENGNGIGYEMVMGMGVPEGGNPPVGDCSMQILWTIGCWRAVGGKL